jgi:AraC-like DNA-binding protein
MIHHQHVVLACFGAAPFVGALEAAARTVASIISIHDRGAVHQQVCMRRPEFLLLPLADPRGVSMLPIIELLARDAPSTKAVVCIPPGGHTLGLAHALQLHATLLTWASDVELKRGVAAILTPATFSDADRRAIESVLYGLEPVRLIPILLESAALAHRRISVGALASVLGISRRTLNRLVQHYAWPRPSELIIWGRLLRAGAVRMRVTDSTHSVATAAGFNTPAALTAAIRGRFGPEATLDDLSLMRLGRTIRQTIAGAQR